MGKLLSQVLNLALGCEWCLHCILAGRFANAIRHDLQQQTMIQTVNSDLGSYNLDIFASTHRNKGFGDGKVKKTWYGWLWMSWLTNVYKKKSSCWQTKKSMYFTYSFIVWNPTFTKVTKLFRLAFPIFCHTGFFFFLSRLKSESLNVLSFGLV